MTGFIEAPGYWMHETSGVLAPAVEAFLLDLRMTPPQIAAMRAYLRQWIMSPAWQGPEIKSLRASIDRIESQGDIRRWIDAAFEAHIDPL